MNIVHISVSDSIDGSSKAAYRLHCGMRQRGLQSSMLVKYKQTDDNDVVQIKNKRNQLRKVLDKLVSYVNFGIPRILYPQKNKEVQFYTGLFGTDNVFDSSYLFNADVIHIHCPIHTSFFSITEFEKVIRLGKPIVWTFHDMWPFTGGCVYTLGCNNYQGKCGKCLVLNSKRKLDISTYLQSLKKRYSNYTNINLVAVSRWLSSCASNSSVFQKKKVNVISNIIPDGTFGFIPKEQARNVLGLPMNDQIILIGASNLKYGIKGMDYFYSTLDSLKKIYGDRLLLTSFGNNPNITLDGKIRVKHYGSIDNDRQLNLLYSAANIFVGPSIQEAFGQVFAESIICGTPAISFSNSGVEDIIEHKRNGYLAKNRDSNDLAKGITWVFENLNKPELLKKNSELIKEKFSSSVIVSRYKTIYEEIIEQ